MLYEVITAYIEILVFTKNTQIKVDGWESLRPYRLGFVMGLKKIEEQTQGMQVYMADTNETIFKLLQRGRFDIARITSYNVCYTKLLRRRLAVRLKKRISVCASSLKRWNPLTG